MSQRIKIAKITTAHGIKGFVKLKVFAENPTDIEQYNPLFLDENGNKTITIKLKNKIKDGWVAEIDGITDRNKAEELRNTTLYMNEEALPELEEGEIYYKDLIGMSVLDNNGENFGIVLSTQDYGAGDLLEIQPNTGKTFFFPFNDATCPTIDKDAKTIQTVDIQDYIF